LSKIFFSELEGATSLVGAPSRLALKSFLVKLRKAQQEVTDSILSETETKIVSAIEIIEKRLRENQ